MKFIIPIQNLVIDNIFKLGGVILVPPRFFHDDSIEFEDCMFNETDKNDISSIFDICQKDYLKQCSNYTVAMLECPFTLSEFNRNIPVEEFIFLEKVCYKVERALDYLRLLYCQIGHMESLPGIPGIIGGYRTGIVIDTNNKQSRSLLGNIYNIYVTPGIGLYADNIEAEEVNSPFYNIIFSERTDVVYNTCRVALARINEAMYMNNINTSFTYLMSTLEMLASDEYIQFKKVKTSIVSFIANDKLDYHMKCEKLRNMSENIRTEIVHNGKNLYDLFNSETEVNKLLHYLTYIILEYCESVINTGIVDFNTLLLEKERRIDCFNRN